MRMPHYYVGLDLGQRSDFTTLAVIEEPIWAPEDRPIACYADPEQRQVVERSGWISPAEVVPQTRINPRHIHAMGGLEQLPYPRAAVRPVLSLRHLERFPLGTPYPMIVRRVQALLSARPLANDAVLLVDATGVGRPVIDMLEQANLQPHAITITGGSTVTADGFEFRVPKRDLAMAVQVLLQNRRLVFAAELPLLDVLKQELQSFEVKINPDTAHDSYLSWREGAHDDLVLAVALACWYREAYGGEQATGFSFAYAFSSRRPL